MEPALDISGLEGDTHDTQTIGEQLVQLGSGEIRAPHSPPPSSSSSSAPTPPAALKGEQQQSEKASKPTPYPWSPRLRGIIQLSRMGNVLRNV